MLVFHCEASIDLTDISTGAFDRPSVAWPTFTPGERAEGDAPKACADSSSSTASSRFPSNAGPSLDGWFLLPHRPATGWPVLLTRGDGRTLLLAPLDAFHEQTIGLNGERSLRLARRPGDGAGRLRYRPRRTRRRRPSFGARRMGSDAARRRGDHAPGSLAGRGRFVSFVLDRQRFCLLVQDRARTRRRRIDRRCRR